MNSDPKEPITTYDVFIRDPLSENARKDRRSLLALSLAGITIVKAGFIPTKIEALGIIFQPSNQSALLWILGLTTLYYLLSFMVCAAADFLSWRLSYIKALREELVAVSEDFSMSAGDFSAEQDFRKREVTPRRWVFTSARVMGVLRPLFEFGFPLALGCYATVVLFSNA